MPRRILGATVVVAALAFAAPAQAAVDLNDLNPPPPDFYTCTATGGGAVCHGKQTNEYFAAWDVACPQGFTMVEHGVVVETARRVYDRDGNLVRRDLHDSWDRSADNVIFNPDNGKSVPYTSQVTEHDTFAVPGDFDTMTARFSGVGYIVHGEHGLAAHDSGQLVFGPDGDLIDSAGPHTLFDGLIGPVCDLLA
jgi:hypothetical protein